MQFLGMAQITPDNPTTAADLDERLGQRPGWSEGICGVAVRYLADTGLAQSELAGRALKAALANGRIDPASIDLLISTAAVPEQALPSMAGAVAAHAGLPSGLAAFDVNASCLGFLVALRLAQDLLDAGTYRRIAIVASDLASRGVDWQTPEASLVFGDGAAALVIAGGTEVQLLAYRQQTWPEWRDLCEIRAGGTRRNVHTSFVDADFLFQMDGHRLFRHVHEVMPEFLRGLFGDAMTLTDIDLVVPHQASHLAMRHIARLLGIDSGRLVNIYPRFGNQVSASVPTALAIARSTGRIKAGDRVLLLGTAAGLSIAGMVLQF